MPGQFQHTLESLRKEAVDIAARGVTAFMVFAVPERKDAEGSEASNPDGIAQRAFTTLRDDLGDEHVVIGRPVPGRVHRPRPLRRARSDDRRRGQRRDARAVPADRASRRPRRASPWSGPSGMMDGQVAAIRDALDAAGSRRRRHRGLRREVRERAVRAVPRRGGVRAAVRRSRRLPDGPGQRRRGAARDPRRHRPRAPTS